MKNRFLCSAILVSVDLRGKAMRYRGMVFMVTDQRPIEALRSLASEYEATADQLERDVERKPQGN
jgi:hypothetical protein